MSWFPLDNIEAMRCFYLSCPIEISEIMSRNMLYEKTQVEYERKRLLEMRILEKKAGKD
ncbi:MAG: hypothetical protein ACYC0D_04985 [Candidatus Humimicrobiaceae bacterium]